MVFGYNYSMIGSEGAGVTTRTPVDSRPAGWIDPKTGRPARPFAILPCLLNIRHAMIAGTDEGFGQFWHKRYQIQLDGIQVTPEEVIRLWRQDFPNLWPPGNRFYIPPGGIENGEIALLKLALPGRLRPVIATGVIVENVTPTAFTYTAFSGHPIAGSMSFSAFSRNGSTVAQADAYLRASDPLFEIGIRLTGKKEDQFWRLTLENLARALGANGIYSFEVECLDPHLHWNKAGNLFRNAAIRSGIFYLTLPFRVLYYAARPNRHTR